MTIIDSTPVSWPEPPTVPRVEWPVVKPAAKSTARSVAPPVELSRTGRHGVELGDAAVPAAALVNSGTYTGKARHARPKESG